MAFTYGFWTAGLEGTVARMNYCLLGYGLKSEFPTASSANKGMIAYATDEKALYYSNGSAWTRVEVVAGNLAETIAGIKTFSSIPVLPASDPTTDNQAVRKYYADNAVNFTVGDLIFISSNAEKVIDSSTYILAKEIQIGVGTALRIKFDLKSGTSGYPVWGRIYRNGAAVGTERSWSSLSYTTFSEDISGWGIGDLVQIYAKYGTSTDVYIRNFRLYAARYPHAYVTLD